MNVQHITLGEGGRLVIPAAYRKVMHIMPGDDLIIKVKEGELRIISQKYALERIRKTFKHLKDISGITSATDDFLKFRKEDS